MTAAAQCLPSSPSYPAASWQMFVPISFLAPGPGLFTVVIMLFSPAMRTIVASDVIIPGTSVDAYVGVPNGAVDTMIDGAV